MGNVREISLKNHRWATSRSLSAIAVRLRSENSAGHKVQWPYGGT